MYYRGLKKKEHSYTGALALGTRLHKALELHYSIGTPLIVAHSSLVEVEKSLLVGEGRDIYDLESEAQLGQIMLEGYLEWAEENGVDVDFEIVSTEETIIVPLFNGEVELQGKLDMRVRRISDGVRFFRDWKTVGTSIAEYASMAHLNEQILTYMLLEKMKEGEENRTDGGLITLLRKVKRTAKATPPFYDQIEVRHNIFTLRSFWNRLHGTITDLMRVRKALDVGESPSSFAYPHPTRDCKWKCPFFSICPMFDDGSAVEIAIEELYEIGDPYSYYDSDNKKGSE